MIQLDPNAYEKLIEGAKVITEDRYGAKVMSLPGGTLVKLFRRKRLLSSALIWPYAQRFKYNAAKLREKNISSVEVIRTFRVKTIARDAVEYIPLQGSTLREALRNTDCQYDLLKSFAAFFAGLHDRGIYFRAIHFGNVIIQPDGNFGLIDLSEIRTSRRPLNVVKRVRNFKPIFRYPEDRLAILNYGFGHFLESYVANSGLSSHYRSVFRTRMVKEYRLDGGCTVCAG